jgi:hypothetical protein
MNTGMTHAGVVVAVVWAERNESPSQLAIPLSATFRALAKASPEFAGEWKPEEDPYGTFPSTDDEWRAAVENAADPGRATTSMGYTAHRPGTADVVTVRLVAGTSTAAPHQSGNHLTVSIDSAQPGGAVDLTGVEGAFRQVITSLVAIWRPDWASVIPRDAHRLQIDDPWTGPPAVGSLTWVSDAASDVPHVVAGAEVRRYMRGRLLGVPSTNSPTAGAAEILVVQQALEASSALRQPPAQQQRARITDPATFEVALRAYLDFDSGRAIRYRPERVLDVFPGEEGDRLLAQISDAGDVAWGLWTARWDPTAAEVKAEARWKLAVLVPHLTSGALDLLVEWWIDLQLY